MKEKKLTAIDLFCGCGGMSKGLSDAGINVVLGIDIWDKAVESYNSNFDHKAYQHDLTMFPPEKCQEMYIKDNIDIDIITGASNCACHL